MYLPGRSVSVPSAWTMTIGTETSWAAPIHWSCDSIPIAMSPPPLSTWTRPGQPLPADLQASRPVRQSTSRIGPGSLVGPSSTNLSSPEKA